MGAAIEAHEVSKKFRLYNDKKSSLKERLVRRDGAGYTDFWALQDISLEIAEGSTFGLIGHNGSGKSTFLKLLAGIHRPTSGRVDVHGRVSALLELGAGFHPELSGRDNILLNGAILGMSKKQILESIDRIIDFADFEDVNFIDSPVKVYSSGMYVKLGFSIAVNLDPEILIIDEIVAVGDEKFQRKCFDHLHELRKKGVTICFVSHSLPLVQSMCDQVAWFDHGRLRGVGPAVELVDDYLRVVNDAERGRFDDEASAAVHGAGRRGSGEVQITDVSFHDASGATVNAVVHGDSLTVRTHYRAAKPVSEPVFGLAFVNELGHALAGPNTRLSDVGTRTLEGEGWVEFAIPSVRLVPGDYEVTAAITDHSTTHIFDQRDKEWTFHVQPGRGFQPSGLVVLDGAWRGDAIAPASVHQA